jgi:hypothetical protein
MLKLSFARFPPSVFVRAHAEWLIAGIKLFGKERFLALTPPLFKRQFVWDRKVNHLISFEIRDYVDWFTSTQIFSQHDYDLSRFARTPDFTALYDGILQAGRTPLILDCGGNIGLAARYFAATWPKAKVLSIEPDPANAKLAVRNTICTRVEDSGDTDVISLATLLDRPDLQNCQPFIVKIDIEGFEADLFAGDTRWIDRTPILIIELHDWMLPGTANSRAFLTAIAGKDRDFLHRGENIISIANTIPSFAVTTAQ